VLTKLAAGESRDLIAVLDERPLPWPWRFAVARLGRVVLIAMTPGYDPTIVAAHAAVHRPAEEQAPIREALGLPGPARPVDAARRVLQGRIRRPPFGGTFGPAT
jgi:hypothetical protein